MAPSRFANSRCALCFATTVIGPADVKARYQSMMLKLLNNTLTAVRGKLSDQLREIVREVMQQVLESEMTDALGAQKGERTAEPAAAFPAPCH